MLYSVLFSAIVGKQVGVDKIANSEVDGFLGV